MMRTILFIVLGLFIAQNVGAQNDSLIIKLEDYGQMVIILPNLTKAKQEGIGINDLYKKFYEDFKSIDKSSFKKNCYLLNYDTPKWDDQNNRSLTIKALDDFPDVFYFQDGKQIASHSGKYSLKLTKYGDINIVLDSLGDFEKVSLLNLDTLYLQALKHLQDMNLRKRNLYTILYPSSNNNIDESSNYVVSKKSLDYLQLYCSAGILAISTNFAPELNINLDIDFGSKGRFDHSVGISSTLLFMPDKNDFFNISTYSFINANYQHKFNNKGSHRIGIGYLLGGGGDSFSKNTWNAFWQTNINKMGVKLGGYYTKNSEGNYVLLPSIGFVFGI